MKYLLDSCSLMHACRYDFPMDQYGDFWKWLVELGKDEVVKIPEAIIEEVEKGTDSLSLWIQENKPHFVTPKAESLMCLSTVIEAYSAGQELSEKDLERMAADPYLISQAHYMGKATVVSDELSAPNVTTPGKKKIPDICNKVGVPCARLSRVIWDLKK